MIKNIIIGKDSSVTNFLCKYLKNIHVFSANELNVNELKDKIKLLYNE